MLIAGDYPANPAKLEEVARYGKVPSRTLRRWYNREYGAPPDNIVTQQKRELADVFEDIAYKYLTHAAKDDVIEAVSGNAAVVTAATAVDKMRLLRGLPTEVIAIVPDVVSALQKAGYDPVSVFNDLIAESERRYQQRLSAGSAGQTIDVDSV